ncbi:hypothetical protein COCOBI_16-1120 [Coccomyxa sp. Obi]|nr:hypothetical protein COCOBI_16-1120 [Coccomyxa sp. Obi]
MERATFLLSVVTIGFAVVLVAGQDETDVAREDTGQIFTHLHIPFPKKRLLKQQKLYSTKVVGLPTEVVCSSLLGPDCFAPGSYGGTSEKTASVDRRRSNGAQGHGEVLGEAPRSGGVMEQYMDASQSLLSSVHGDSLTSREKARQAGAREGRVLDDVVIVKVGRSVKSVYDEEGEQDWLERTTGANDRPLGASGDALQREREGSSGNEGATVEAAGDAQRCESGLDDGSDDEGTCEGPLAQLRELDTTEYLEQKAVEDVSLQEHEYYDHYFNASANNPDDEYYSYYDDSYYLPLG